MVLAPLRLLLPAALLLGCFDPDDVQPVAAPEATPRAAPSSEPG